MRHTFLLLAAILGFSTMAQEGPKISSAVIATDRNDLAEAKRYIDEAAQIIGTKPLTEVRSKDLAKFYYYQGLINMRIARSEDPAIKALDTAALNKAAEGFKNLIAYEKEIGKERYTDDAKQQIPYVALLYAQRGIDASMEKNYLEAYDYFNKTYQLKKDFNLGTDTAMLYNTALMAQNAGNNEKALEVTQKLIDMGYKGVQYKATEVESGKVVEFASPREMDLAVKSKMYKDPTTEGDLRPELYITAANLYKEEGDTAKYDEWVAKGRTMFPENESLLRAELQTFLDKKQYDKALVNLNLAIEKDPENKLFHYIKGYILQTQVKDAEQARAAYEEALKIDSNYIEPLYMIGLTYVDAANAYTEEMNSLQLSEKTKYNELQKKQNAAFKKALPYFERAHEVAPKDKDTLMALKEVYYKLKNYQKAKDIQAELDAL